MFPRPLVIRIADTKDVVMLTELSITTFRQAYGAQNKKEHMDDYIACAMSEACLREELKDTSNLFVLAEYDDIPVGFAKMRTLKTPEDLAGNNPIEIERIYVLQEYQKNKIGAALMNYCMTHAKAEGHDIVWLGVWEHNHKAIDFYKQWGFVHFGSHIFPFGDNDQVDLLMKIAL